MKLDTFYDGENNEIGGGYECPLCFVIWTEDELFELFADNEDTVLTAISFDQCPKCTVELRPDFSFQSEVI